MAVEKPSKDDLYDAADICDRLAEYIEEKWPQATTEYDTLYAAAELLETHSTPYEDEEEIADVSLSSATD